MAEAPNFNRTIRGMATTERTSLEEESDNIDDVSPSSRLKQVSDISTSYAKEYRLNIVARLLRRNIPLDQIAQQLGVSQRTVERDRQLLIEEMRKGAKKLDVNVIIGETLGFYQETIGMALRAASVSKAPMQIRMLALRTAQAAQKDKTGFLEKVGVFEALPFIPAEQGGVDDMAELSNMIEAILNDDAEGYKNVIKPTVNDMGLFDGPDDEEEEIQHGY